MYYCCTYCSPIGELTLASDGESLTGLWIQGQKHFAQNLTDHVYSSDFPVFQETARWLDDYFASTHSPAADVPLKPEGSPFRQRVWQLLLQIPWGQTITYCQIANMLGSPGPLRLSAALWATILSPLSSPATGYWDPTEVSPDTQAVQIKSSGFCTTNESCKLVKNKGLSLVFCHRNWYTIPIKP